MYSLSLTINKKNYQFDDLDPRTTLLDLCRHQLQITGPKKGCDHGQCGACTMLVNGQRINSCLALAVMHENDDITTIEGIGMPDMLSDLQEAFKENDAFQCGYCTPGQICSATAMIKEIKQQWPSYISKDLQAPDVTLVDEIAERMSGNICRCSAYPNIIKAISQVLEKELEDELQNMDGADLELNPSPNLNQTSHTVNIPKDKVTGIWSPPPSESQVSSQQTIYQAAIMPNTGQYKELSAENTTNEANINKENVNNTDQTKPANLGARS